MSTSTALATEDNTNNLKKLINLPSVKAEFEKALPQHLSADRFIRIATTALLRTPALADCNKESFMKCLMELSAWGIEPDGRRAHLIPFKRRYQVAGQWKETLDCTLLLDWKGLCELALRSGFITKLHADIVCDNDIFTFNLGEIEEHRIDFRKPRGEPYAAYARAVTKDGETFVAVMTKDEILAIRDDSQGWNAFQKGFAKQSPWDPKNQGSEHEMWKKTAFRRLSKWLPLSAEFRDAIDHDDTRDFGDSDPRDVTPKKPTITNAFAKAPVDAPGVVVDAVPAQEEEQTAESAQEAPDAQEHPQEEERSSGEVMESITGLCQDRDIGKLGLEKRLRSAGILSETQTFNGRLGVAKLVEIENFVKAIELPTSAE